MSRIGLGRRATLAGGTALAAASLIQPREARATRGLTVVLESEVTILDPHYITATITRTFGLHVFDMLFAMNEKGEIKPQMVESWEASSDKLGWTFVLRDGLKFHDGAPVTAADCVASLKRWAVRDALGNGRRAWKPFFAQGAFSADAGRAGQAQRTAARDNAGPHRGDAG